MGPQVPVARPRAADPYDPARVDAAAASSPAAVRAAALRLVERSGVGAGARALDLPCGTGLLAQALAARGLAVRGGDLDPGPARAAGVEADAVDLERPLPYPDAAADLVTCVEGIEHVEAQAPLVAELARVLRPGGALVLTTPNVLGRPSRRSLARFGYARFFRPAPAGSAFPYEHAHRHPIDVVRLDHLLRGAGLVPAAWDCERGPDGAPTPLGALGRRLAAPRLRRHNARAELLLEPAVWFGRVVALLARKPVA
jgi:SAM-dependent methyltransferase